MVGNFKGKTYCKNIYIPDCRPQKCKFVSTPNGALASYSNVKANKLASIGSKILFQCSKPFHGFNFPLGNINFVSHYYTKSVFKILLTCSGQGWVFYPQRQRWNYKPFQIRQWSVQSQDNRVSNPHVCPKSNANSVGTVSCQDPQVPECVDRSVSCLSPPDISWTNIEVVRSKPVKGSFKIWNTFLQKQIFKVLFFFSDKCIFTEWLNSNRDQSKKGDYETIENLYKVYGARVRMILYVKMTNPLK